VNGTSFRHLLEHVDATNFNGQVSFRGGTPEGKCKRFDGSVEKIDHERAIRQTETSGQTGRLTAVPRAARGATFSAS